MHVEVEHESLRNTLQAEAVTATPRLTCHHNAERSAHVKLEASMTNRNNENCAIGKCLDRSR